MKYNTLFAVILAAALLLSLTACGTTQSPAASGSLNSTTQQTEQPSAVETAATEASPTHGEEEPWKTALAEELFQKYGVLPEYYEDLGDGIYLVYVEVGGEVLPFVTVDSATGEYHG